MGAPSTAWAAAAAFQTGRSGAAPRAPRVHDSPNARSTPTHQEVGWCAVRKRFATMPAGEAGPPMPRDRPLDLDPRCLVVRH